MAKIKDELIRQQEAGGNFDGPEPGYQFHDEKGEHLHTLNGRPLIGTTTVCQVISKPLVWWAAGMAVGKLGWTNGKYAKPEDRLKCAETALAAIRDLSSEAYLKLLDDAYSAHSKRLKEAAKGGTDMHAELEIYVKRCLAEGGKPIAIPTLEATHQAVAIFAAWALENVDHFIWSEAHCYSETMWTGGISDCGAILKDDKTAIIDFKSSKEAYFSQFVQLGGYAQAIEENGLYTSTGEATHSPIKIDAITVFPFGGGAPTTIYAVEDYQRAFISALTIHKLQTSFTEQH